VRSACVILGARRVALVGLLLILLAACAATGPIAVRRAEATRDVVIAPEVLGVQRVCLHVRVPVVEDDPDSPVTDRVACVSVGTLRWLLYSDLQDVDDVNRTLTEWVRELRGEE